MRVKKCLHHLTVLFVLFALLAQWQVYAGWFKDDPPPPPTWQDKVKQGWEKTCSWCSDHKEEIAVGAAVVAAATIAYLNSDSGEVSKPKYTYDGGATMGPGLEFTRDQKALWLQQNREWNGGVLRSAISGIELHPPQQCRRGVTPDPLEAQVDHIYPRSKGGWNTPENAQIISREENIRKSDHVEGKAAFWNRFWNE